MHQHVGRADRGRQRADRVLGLGDQSRIPAEAGRPVQDHVTHIKERNHPDGQPDEIRADQPRDILGALEPDGNGNVKDDDIHRRLDECPHRSEIGSLVPLFLERFRQVPHLFAVDDILFYELDQCSHAYLFPYIFS